MTHITEDQKTAVQQPNWRPYHTPRLFVYGAVRQLTAAGSVDSPEGSGKGNTNKRP